jgi:hypothetical protein
VIAVVLRFRIQLVDATAQRGCGDIGLRAQQVIEVDEVAATGRAAMGTPVLLACVPPATELAEMLVESLTN